MKIDRIRLENFKCYEEADLALDPGVTVVHGLNGSGKSSLLEAMFFALYGARALERTLDGIVTIGEDETTVELWFTHEGNDYQIRRRIRMTDDRAQTVECVMDGPSRTIDGARDVRDAVSQLLRMDSAAFLNCAYVRQGEVNSLINATPDERQDMIDDLLQLGVLEDYRERATEARRAVQRVRDGRKEVASDLGERIAEKEGQDLHERLNGLESELREVESEIDRYEGNKADAEETLEDARSVLEEYEERRRELESLDEDITELETTIQETAEEREELAEDLEELRTNRQDIDQRVTNLGEVLELDNPDTATVSEELEEVRSEIETVRSAIEDHRGTVQRAEGEIDSAEERAADLLDRAEDRRAEAEELEAEVNDLEETIEAERSKLSDLEAEVEEVDSKIASSAVEDGDVEGFLARRKSSLESYRDRVSSLEAELETARERVSEAEELIEAGRCPECGQPIDDSPHVEALDERRERVTDLESTVESARAIRDAAAAAVERAETLLEAAREREHVTSQVEQLRKRIEEREATIEEKRARVTELRETADELEAEAETARDTIEERREEATVAREKIGDLNERINDLQDRHEQLETLQSMLQQRRELEGDIERIEDRRTLLGEQNDDRRDRLESLREQRRELTEAIDDDRIESARADVHRAENYLEEVEDEIAALQDRRDELVGAIDSTKNEIQELESLRERRERIVDRVERLDELLHEVERLESMYGDLRGELRQRNVDTLERMLNDTFDLVYGNESYDRIELSERYELTVYQKDGDPLEPEQLSGGERALFNLSLRCAVYRLLAEGVEGAAPMPPFVLDEPTVYLDAGHVSRLVELIEMMRTEVGVEQILVVSHDEELLGAADAVVRVEKDPTSNRSHLERTTAAAKA